METFEKLFARFLVFVYHCLDRIVIQGYLPLMTLMEVLLHGGTQLNGWRSADIHQAVLTTFGLSATTYTLTQLRYDLRKLKAHGLLERIG